MYVCAERVLHGSNVLKSRREVGELSLVYSHVQDICRQAWIRASQQHVTTLTRPNKTRMSRLRT
jgi:hypothetical protein